MGRRLHSRRHVAAFGLYLPGLIGLGGARGQGQAGNRTDRGQGLTTKAQAKHLLQVFQLANFAGGMSRQSQRQVIGGDPAAVVTHPQQLGAALLDVHLDAPGARTLVRPLEEDMFRFGSAEAYKLGYDAARAELGGAPAKSHGAKQES